MNSYLFDKRRRKRNFIKYLIIFSLAFVPVVLFNMYVIKGLDNWLVVLIDSVIILAFALVGNVIAKKIFEKQDAKLERKKKLREEMNERKKQILEDSYKQKRAKKIEEKNNKKVTGEKDENIG